MIKLLGVRLIWSLYSPLLSSLYFESYLSGTINDCLGEPIWGGEKGTHFPSLLHLLLLVQATPAPATDTVVPSTPSPGSAAEPGNQTVPVSVVPIHEKKYWEQKSAHLVGGEVGETESSEAEPSPEEEEEEEEKGGEGGRDRNHEQGSNHPIPIPE